MSKFATWGLAKGIGEAAIGHAERTREDQLSAMEQKRKLALEAVKNQYAMEQGQQDFTNRMKVATFEQGRADTRAEQKAKSGMELEKLRQTGDMAQLDRKYAQAVTLSALEHGQDLEQIAARGEWNLKTAQAYSGRGSGSDAESNKISVYDKDGYKVGEKLQFGDPSTGYWEQHGNVILPANYMESKGWTGDQMREFLKIQDYAQRDLMTTIAAHPHLAEQLITLFERNQGYRPPIERNTGGRASD